MNEPGAEITQLLRAATLALDVNGADGGIGVQGTGFLIAPGVVATCAHVLAEARDRLPETVRGRFALSGEDIMLETVPEWYIRDGQDGLDLAFLRAPKSAEKPVALLLGSAKVGDAMWAFGHPAGKFRGGQSALFTYQGPSRLWPTDGGGGTVSGGWEPERVVGTPIGGGYSGSPVLNRRTGAVIGMLCSSDLAGSAHLVSADDMIAALPDLVEPQRDLAGHVDWLRALDDAQIRAGGWRFPGPRLRAYLGAAARASREHPYPGVVPGITPPPLSAVYLRQRVQPQTRPAAGATSNDDTETVPAEVILDQDGDCVVIGAPGAGKSSLLRIGLIATAEHWTDTPAGSAVPIRLLAADLVEARPLPEAIAAGVRADLSAVGLLDAWPSDFFAAEPMRGVPWLVLIDGLDELADPSARRAVLAKLAGIASADGPSPYRFVVATRPLATPELEVSNFPDWAVSHYELQPLGPHDLVGFAEGWFTVLGMPEPRRAAQDLVAALRHNAVTDLARTPLMAAMLCQLYATNPDQHLPAGRAGVYERFVALLLERQHSTGASSIHTQTRLALERYGSGALTAATRVVEGSIALIARLAHVRLGDDARPAVELLADWTCAERPHHVPATAWSGFLGELLRRSGLLTERGGEFAFLHQTLMEYLAARHVTADKQTNDAAFDHIFGQWHRPRVLAPKRWIVPRLDESLIGFLVAAWQDTPALTASLTRLATHAGLDGCQFIAARAAEGTHLSETVVDAASSTLATIASRPSLHSDDRRAAAALAQLGDSHGLAILRAIATDSAIDSYGRRTAARTLARLGDSLGTDLLAAMATNPLARYDERRWAAETLATLGDERGLDQLATIASSATVESTIRRWSAEALARRGDERAIAPLAAIATDPTADDLDRRRASEALASLGDTRGVDLLVAITVDSGLDSYSRRWAAEALAALGDNRGADAMTVMASDPSTPDADRRWAAQALAAHGDNRGINLLTEAALNPALDGDARWEAASALVRFSDPGSSNVLAQLAADEFVDSKARREAAEKLASLGDERGDKLLDKLDLVKWSSLNIHAAT